MYAGPTRISRGSDEWGVEDNVRERFDGLANSIEMERRTLPVGGGLARGVHRLMEVHAPMQAAAKAVDAAPTRTRRCARTCWAWCADGPVATVAFSVDAEYLLIVARKRG